ncbi:Homoserine/homoserine lactone efflux protein [Candidatus Paraburkholderia calva]|nr:Homoserine/homoserine lactone efflux protein [Candidatus Paraburkholderia calva]
MPLHTYLLFLPACFALNMAFGPNNVLSLSNGARNGVLHSVTASFGRLVAFTIMIAITGFGLGALLLASEPLFTVLKFGGAAYLVWLGIKLLRSTSTEQALVVNAEQSVRQDRASLLWKHCKQEFFVAAGNPKAILIFTAFFPQFVDRTHYAVSFAILGATFLMLELVAIAIYALIGARLHFLTTNPKGFVWLNRISGSLMVGFGMLLALLPRPA